MLCFTHTHPRFGKNTYKQPYFQNLSYRLMILGDVMNTVWQLVILEGHEQLTPISLRVICVMLLEMSLESYQMLVKPLFLVR